MSSAAWHRTLKMMVVIAVWVGGVSTPARTATTLQSATASIYMPCLARDFDPRFETEPNGTEGWADVLIGSGIDHFGFHNTGAKLDSDYWRFTNTAPGLMQLTVAGLNGSGGNPSELGQVVVAHLGGGQVGYAGGPPYEITATLTTVDTYVIRVVSTRVLDTGMYTLTVTYP